MLFFVTTRTRVRRRKERGVEVAGGVMTLEITEEIKEDVEGDGGVVGEEKSRWTLKLHLCSRAITDIRFKGILMQRRRLFEP